MKKQVVFCLILSLLYLTCNSQELPKITINNMADKIPADINIKIGKLDNGMTYYIKKNQKPENNAVFRIIVKTGAINQDADQDGLAHFTEHMAFNGTKHFPKNQLIDFLQKTGVRFGADVNAGTSYDETKYDLPVPVKDDEFLENTFIVLEDWASGISFDNDMIDAERGVIIAEKRQVNTYIRRMLEKHSQKTYYKSKYGEINIIGDTTALKTFKYDAIKRFYKDWYRPDLMAVVAVGDFDVTKVEKLIKEHLGKIPAVQNPRKREVFDIPFHKETLVSFFSDKELPFEMVTIRVKLAKYDISTFEGFRETLLRSLFFQMLTSRLSEIPKKPNPPLIYSMASEGNAIGNKRMATYIAASMTGGLKKAYETLLTESYRIVENGFTQSEFDRTKMEILSIAEKAYNERASRTTDKIVEICSQNFTQGEPIPGIEYQFALAKEILSKIQLSEVNELAPKLIKKEDCVVEISQPDKPEATKITESDALAVFNDVAARKIEAYKDIVSDKPLFDKKITPGKIASEVKNDKLGTLTLTLSNGAKVILKETDFKKDQILFEAFSEGGYSVANDEELVSAMTAPELITEAGVDAFDINTLQKMLAGKMVGISPYIDNLTHGIRGASSAKDLETLLQLTHLYFKYPRKDGDSYKSFLDKYRPVISSRGNVPDNQFNDSVQVTLRQHHKRNILMTLESFDKLNLDKAYSFYNDRFANAGDFTFVLAGDFRFNDIKPLLENYIGSLPSTNSKASWKDEGIRYPKVSVTNRFSIGKESRSHVKLMFPGEFDWTQENRFRLRCISEWLENRFTEEIREKKSGVYSPFINVSLQKYPVPEYCFNIDFVCDPDHVEELIQASLDLLQDMKTKPDEAGVLKVIKSYLIQHDISIKTNEFWKNEIAEYLKVNDNPEDLLKFKDVMNSMKPAELSKSMNEYMKLDRMLIVVLDPEKK